MNRIPKLLTVFTATAASVALAASMAGAASTDGPPPPPPWVNGDGTVDETRMPDYMPMVDSTGKLVVDSKGKPVLYKVPKGPPTITPGQAGRGNEISREVRQGVETIQERPNLVAPGQNK